MFALAPRKLWLLPGELAAITGHYELEPSPVSPLTAGALTPSERGGTPMHDLLRTALTGIDPSAFRLHLEALAHPSACVRVRRGMRPLVPTPVFACAANPEWDSTTIYAPQDDGSATLMFLPDRSALKDWLMEGTREMAPPEIPLLRLPRLAASGLAVVLALADLFRERYPDPNPAWKPDVPIVIAVDRLAAQLDSDDPHSLPTIYEQLAERDLPRLGRDEMERVLFMFANEQLIVLDADAPPITRFELSDRFAWTLRCLAWWDLTLSIQPWAPAASRTGEAVTVIQASSLWRCTDLLDTPGPTAELSCLDAQELERAVEDILARQPAEPLALVCSSCGGHVDDGERFCAACGSPVGSAPAEPPAPDPVSLVCAGCGQPLRPAARFCGACGRPAAGGGEP